MLIKTFPEGPLGSNMYAVEFDRYFFIVDPSVDPARAALKDKELKGIFITHGHFDHIFCLDKWVSLYPEAPVMIHREDVKLLKDPDLNCSSDMWAPLSFDIDTEDAASWDGRIIGDTKISVLHTPGHSPGEVCYIFKDTENVMFTGDMLFRSSIGRTDLPLGSAFDMKQSLSKISSISEDLKIYPGHGPSTTLDTEKKTNPYLFLT